MDYINTMHNYIIGLLLFGLSSVVQAEDKTPYQVELMTGNADSRIICSIILEKNPTYNNVFCVYKFGENYYRNNDDAKEKTDGLVSDALKDISDEEVKKFIKIGFNDSAWKIGTFNDEGAYLNATLKLFIPELFKSYLPKISDKDNKKSIKFSTEQQKELFENIKKFLQEKIPAIDAFNGKEYYSLINTKKTFEKNKEIINSLKGDLEVLKNKLKKLDIDNKKEEDDKEDDTSSSYNFIPLENFQAVKDYVFNTQINDNNTSTVDDELHQTNQTTTEARTEEKNIKDFLDEIDKQITQLTEALDNYPKIEKTEQLLSCNAEPTGKNKEICKKYQNPYPEDSTAQYQYKALSKLIKEMTNHINSQKEKYQQLQKQLDKIENYITNIKHRDYIIYFLVVFIVLVLVYIFKLLRGNKNKDEKIIKKDAIIIKKDEKITAFKILNYDIINLVLSDIIKNHPNIEKKLNAVEDKYNKEKSNTSKKIKKTSFEKNQYKEVSYKIEEIKITEKIDKDDKDLIYQKVLDKIKEIVSNILKDKKEKHSDVFISILSEFSTSDTLLKEETRQKLLDSEIIKQYQQKDNNQQKILAEGAKQMLKQENIEKNSDLISNITKIIEDKIDHTQIENKKMIGGLIAYFKTNEKKLLESIYEKITDLAYASLFDALKNIEDKNELLKGTDIEKLTEKFKSIKKEYSELFKKQNEAFDGTLSNKLTNNISKLEEDINEKEKIINEKEKINNVLDKEYKELNKKNKELEDDNNQINKSNERNKKEIAELTNVFRKKQETQIKYLEEIKASLLGKSNNKDKQKINIVDRISTQLNQDYHLQEISYIKTQLEGLAKIIGKDTPPYLDKKKNPSFLQRLFSSTKTTEKPINITSDQMQQLQQRFERICSEEQGSLLKSLNALENGVTVLDIKGNARQDFDDVSKNIINSIENNKTHFIKEKQEITEHAKESNTDITNHAKKHNTAITEHTTQFKNKVELSYQKIKSQTETLKEQSENTLGKISKTIDTVNTNIHLFTQEAKESIENSNQVIETIKQQNTQNIQDSASTIESQSLISINELQKKSEIVKQQAEASIAHINRAIETIKEQNIQNIQNIKDSAKTIKNQSLVSIDTLQKKSESVDNSIQDKLKEISEVTKSVDNSIQNKLDKISEVTETIEKQSLKNIDIAKQKIDIIKQEKEQQIQTITTQSQQKIVKIKEDSHKKIGQVNNEKRLLLTVLEKHFDLSHPQDGTTLSTWIKIIDKSFVASEFSGDMHQMFHQRLNSAEGVYARIQKNGSADDKNILAILQFKAMLDKLSHYKQSQSNPNATGVEWNSALQTHDKYLHNQLIRLSERLRTYFTMRNANFNQLSLDIYILSYLGERFLTQEGQIIRMIRPALLHSKKSNYHLKNYKIEGNLLPRDYRKLIKDSVLDAIKNENDDDIVIDVHSYGYEYQDASGEIIIEDPVVFTSIDSLNFKASTLF